MPRTYMSFEEWKATGESLFGLDYNDWEFVCPLCGHVQTPADFTAIGHHPKLAERHCIGYYNGSKFTTFGKPKGSPCDYSTLNFFQIAFGPAEASNSIVVIEHERHIVWVFPFNDPTAKPAEKQEQNHDLVPCTVPGPEGAR